MNIMIELLGIKYISDKEASKRYGYSTSWFQKKRSQKKPPPYIQLLGKGKILYPIDKTDKWFMENIIAIE
jgi:hypothetical protein